MAFVALGFFSLIFHFGKSPPLSIKPEVHRVGESKRGRTRSSSRTIGVRPDTSVRPFFQDSVTAKTLLDGLFCGWVIVTVD